MASKGRIIAWINTPMEAYAFQSLLRDSWGYVVDIEEDCLVLREEADES